MEHNAAPGSLGSRRINIDMNGSRVLVTGATGFLGQHLVPRLVHAGARVYATARTPLPRTASPVRWISLDLTDGGALSTLVQALEPDLVFHLGGRVSGAVEANLVLPTFDTLLASSIALLSAAQAGVVGRLVLLGSADEPREGSIPASPYGAAKGAMTAYAKLYAQAFGAPVVCVRPTEVFGPGQAPSKLLPYVTASALRGEAPQVSSGTRRGDWIFVDDVMDGLLLAARDAPSGSDLDLGTGELHSNREVVEGLLQALEIDIEPVWGARPDRPHEPERAADTAVTEQAIRWRSRISLTDGLRRTAIAARKEATGIVRINKAG